MAVAWRPRITYGPGSATELQFAFPQRPWGLSMSAIAGARRAASGFGASYVVRRDELLTLHLRFFEYEWPAVRSWLRTVQDMAPFRVYLDRDQPGYSTVTLESPLVDATVSLQRDDDYPGILSLSVTVRREADAPFDTKWFLDPPVAS